MIHPADVGECAAEMLTGSGHDGQVYYIAGKAVTMGETVEAMSKVFGRSIEYMQVPAENFKKALEEKGMPDWAIAHQAAWPEKPTGCKNSRDTNPGPWRPGLTNSARPSARRNSQHPD